MPRLSPDGRRVALDIRDQESDIWIWDLDRENLTKLTSNPSVDAVPVWTPDGAHIVFTSSRDGRVPNLYWQRADFTGVAERLTTNENSQNPSSFSSDGKQLVIQVSVPGNLTDLHLMTTETLLAGKPATGKMETRPLLDSTSFEAAGEISPDGRWLAYYSNSSRTNEVYVRAFPNVESGGQWTISTSGGTRPAWSPNGRELFYLDLNGAMMWFPFRPARPSVPASPRSCSMQTGGRHRAAEPTTSPQTASGSSRSRIPLLMVKTLGLRRSLSS
jgi:serine/threonine-protein kinase